MGLHIGVADVDRDEEVFLDGLDRDAVAVLHERNRSTLLRLGGRTDDEAVGATGETTIGEQRDILAELPRP
ncbi:MAG: hypothetical protein U0Q11_18460 [Vicinamibacterales bacterium]